MGARRIAASRSSFASVDRIDRHGWLAMAVVEHPQPSRMRRVARALARTALYIDRLILETVRYLILLGVDLTRRSRILALRRRQRREGADAADLDRRIAALHQRRIAAWNRWRQLSPAWRWQARFAAVAIAMIAILLSRGFFSDSTNLTAHVETGRPPRNDRPAKSDGDVARKAAADFLSARGNASPGQWLVF